MLDKPRMGEVIDSRLDVLVEYGPAGQAIADLIRWQPIPSSEERDQLTFFAVRSLHGVQDSLQEFFRLRDCATAPFRVKSHFAHTKALAFRLTSPIQRNFRLVESCLAPLRQSKSLTSFL